MVTMVLRQRFGQKLREFVGQVERPQAHGRGRTLDGAQRLDALA
jgi:hypothetical protein